MNWKKTIRRTAADFAWLALSVLLLVVLLLGALQTRQGKDYLVEVLQRVLSEERIRIGAVTGLIPFHFQVEGFGVADSLGDWLVLKRIEVGWSPLPLLRGRFYFTRFNVERMEVTRLPEKTAARKTGAETGGPWPLVLPRLRVKHFLINRLDLGPAVLGKQASFVLKADVRSSSKEGLLDTDVTMEQVEGGNARFTIEASWSPENEALEMKARFEEPAGGVLASAMGLDGPLLFSLDGEGTRKNWNGNLIGVASPLGTADSRLHLKLAKNPEITFSGSFGFNRSYLPEELATWMGEEVSLKFVARPESMETFSLEQLSFKTAGISLEVSGLLDVAGNGSKLDFSLVSQDVSPMEGFLNQRASGALTARGTLSGSRWQPAAVFDVRLEAAALGGVRASALESKWNVDTLDPRGASPSRFRLKGEGRILDLASAQPALVFPKSIVWSGEAEVSSGNPLRLNRVELNSQEFSGTLSGEIDLESLKGSLDVSLDMPDSTLAAVWLGHPLPFLGQTTLKATIRRDSEEQLLTGSLNGKSKIVSEALPLVPLPGKDVTYTTGFSVDRQNKIILSGARMKMDGTTLLGHLALDIQRRIILSTWDLSLSDLAFVSAPLNHPIEGSVRVRGSMEGPFSGIQTRLELSGEDLRLEGEDLQKASAELRLNGLPPNLSGNVSLRMTWHQQPYLSKAHFDLAGSRINFQRISLEGSGMTLDGKLNLELRQWLIEGDLKGKSSDLSTLSPLLGRSLAGSMKLDSKFRFEGDSWKVLLDGNGKDLEAFGGRVQEAELHGEINGKARAPSGTATLRLAGLRSADLRLSELQMSAESDGRRIAYSARIKGHYRQALEIKTSGEALPFSETQEIALNRLTGFYGEMPISLIEPAILVRSGGEVTLGEFLFSLGAGRFEGSGSFKTGELRLNSSLQGLPLSLANIFWAAPLKGVVSANMALRGPPHDLEGKVEVQIREFAVQYQLAEELPPASLEFSASVENHLLRSRLSIEGLTGEPFHASLDLPMILSAPHFRVSVPSSGRLAGMLDGSVNLARLTSFFALHDQSLQGTAKIALVLEGTLQEPSLSGRIVAKNAVYENYRTGTLITEAEIEIEATNRDLRIKRAYGKDGGDGIITAGGWMKLEFSQSFPFRVDFLLNRNRIVRMDVASATVNGSGALEGTFKRATLRGQFTIEPAEIQIPKRLPASFTAVHVVEIHESEGGVRPDQSEGSKSADEADNLFLELSVKIPGRVLVNGRGLESEWKGDLTLKGKASQPELTGVLSLVKGRFDLLSKTFDLKRGSISFAGAVPPRPLLDITGEARAKDLLARLQVTGFIESLQIKLTSEPPYPEEEILAHLLFGRRLHQITPVQAVQLADALNTLRGSEGFDLLGRTRRLLHVDELSIGQTGENEDKPSLKVGKYVSENVYIRVESGISPDTGKASVEWTVTPNITVETEVGVNASAGVGVNWRWDY